MVTKAQVAAVRAATVTRRRQKRSTALAVRPSQTQLVSSPAILEALAARYPIQPPGPPPVIDLSPMTTQPPAMNYNASDSPLNLGTAELASIPASALQGIGATLVSALFNYASIPLAEAEVPFTMVRGRGKTRREHTANVKLRVNNGHMMLALALLAGKAQLDSTIRWAREQAGTEKTKQPSEASSAEWWAWLTTGKLPT